MNNCPCNYRLTGDGFPDAKARTFTRWMTTSYNRRTISAHQAEIAQLLRHTLRAVVLNESGQPYATLHYSKYYHPTIVLLPHIAIVGVQPTADRFTVTFADLPDKVVRGKWYCEVAKAKYKVLGGA